MLKAETVDIKSKSENMPRAENILIALQQFYSNQLNGLVIMVVFIEDFQFAPCDDGNA